MYLLVCVSNLTTDLTSLNLFDIDKWTRGRKKQDKNEAEKEAQVQNKVEVETQQHWNKKTAGLFKQVGRSSFQNGPQNSNDICSTQWKKQANQAVTAAAKHI